MNLPLNIHSYEHIKGDIISLNPKSIKYNSLLHNQLISSVNSIIGDKIQHNPVIIITTGNPIK